MGKEKEGEKELYKTLIFISANNSKSHASIWRDLVPPERKYKEK